MWGSGKASCQLILALVDPGDAPNLLSHILVGETTGRQVGIGFGQRGLQLTYWKPEAFTETTGLGIGRLRDCRRPRPTALHAGSHRVAREFALPIVALMHDITGI